MYLILITLINLRHRGEKREKIISNKDQKPIFLAITENYIHKQLSKKKYIYIRPHSYFHTQSQV